MTSLHAALTGRSGPAPTRGAWYTPRPAKVTSSWMRGHEQVKVKVAMATGQQDGGDDGESIRWTVGGDEDGEDSDVNAAAAFAAAQNDDVFNSGEADAVLQLPALLPRLTDTAALARGRMKKGHLLSVPPPVNRKLPRLSPVKSDGLLVLNSEQSAHEELKRLKNRTNSEGKLFQFQQQRDVNNNKGDGKSCLFPNDNMEYIAIRTSGKSRLTRRTMSLAELPVLLGQHDVRKRLSLDVSEQTTRLTLKPGSLLLTPLRHSLSTNDLTLSSSYPSSGDVADRHVTAATNFNSNLNPLLHTSDLHGINNNNNSNNNSKPAALIDSNIKLSPMKPHFNVGDIEKRTALKLVTNADGSSQVTKSQVLNNATSGLIAVDGSSGSCSAVSASSQDGGTLASPTTAELLALPELAGRKKSLLREPRPRRLRSNTKTVQFGPKMVREVTKLSYDTVSMRSPSPSNDLIG